MWTGEITNEVKRLREDGFSWTHIAQTIKDAYPNELRDYSEMQTLRRCRTVAKGEKHKEQQPKTDTAPSQRYHNGVLESTCLIELFSLANLTPEKILAFHGLDASKWQIVSYTTNIWHGMTGKSRDNELTQLYQSKIVAKPKKLEISLDDIDTYFKSKVYLKPEIIPIQYDASGEVLEICLPDLHTGLLAWAQETGSDYDIKIAAERFKTCFSDIVQRCEGRKFSKIYLATLGDLLHIDNDNQTTTKGTLQQADGRMPKIFDSALEMLIEAIDTLLAIAPVEVAYLSGNHDRLVGYTLIKAISCAYRKQEGIVFDTSPNPQKHRLIGVNLVGWTHGDMSQKNMGNWLQDRARADFGKCKFAEIHSGHLHSESRDERYTSRTVQDRQTYDVGGVVIRHLPTISSASFWEHREGYPTGTKTLMCFVWHETMGLRSTWYSNL